MTRKWEEIEFLDLKERQLLTRLRKSRLNRIATQDRSRSWRQVKLVTVVTLLLAAVAIGGFMFSERVSKLREDLAEARARMRATRLVGTVEISTPTTVWTPLAKTDKMEGEFRLKTSPEGRVDLASYLPNSRISLLARTEVAFSPVKTDPEKPDWMSLTLKIETGAIILHFGQGNPSVETELPQGAKVLGTRGTYRIDVEAKKSHVFVRGGEVQVTDGGEHTETVSPDQQLKIEDGAQFEAPQRFTATTQVFE